MAAEGRVDMISEIAFPHPGRNLQRLARSPTFTQTGTSRDSTIFAQVGNSVSLSSSPTLTKLEPMLNSEIAYFRRVRTSARNGAKGTSRELGRQKLKISTIMNYLNRTILERALPATRQHIDNCAIKL